MNREKQIEEMANALGIAFQLAGTTRFGEVAEVLVNAGYRKASDVAREIFEEIAEVLKDLKDEYRLSDDIREACAVRYAMSKVAELKKKYTETEKGDE